jgi:stearoyl-CoA desaturase (Delta-9 desaturase)
MSWFKKINWTVGLFITITPMVGIAGLIWLICSHQFFWATMIMALVYTYITGVAITAGYHRLFSHRTYKAHPVARVILGLLGASNFEGSVLDWCTDHRNHHLYTDTDRDPYSIKRGFWHAHMGWLFTLDTTKRDFSNVEDLDADPFLHFCHKYYVPVAIFMGFIVPMLFAGLLWGDWLGGLLIGGALRIGFNQQVTFCINSICHMFGKRTYSDKQTACDNWITAVITYGEGYHNYHHQFPLDYRNGVRYFHYDPAKWLIKGMSWFGWATDMRMMSKQKILQYRMRLDEQRLLDSPHEPSFIEQLNGLVLPLREKVMNMATTIEDIEKQLADIKKTYHELKHLPAAYMNERVDDCKRLMVEYRIKLKTTRKELKTTLGLWQHIIKTTKIQPCR